MKKRKKVKKKTKVGKERKIATSKEKRKKSDWKRIY